MKVGYFNNTNWYIYKWLLVSRQDLVSWLQQQIADQKRVDQSTSGVDSAIDILPNSASTKDALSNSDIHLVLPGDTKKQRKQTKQMFLDRGELLLSCLFAWVQATDVS
jgi:hypothetical protein